jgi:hypothetical protein
MSFIVPFNKADLLQGIWNFSVVQIYAVLNVTPEYRHSLITLAMNPETSKEINY